MRLDRLEIAGFFHFAAPATLDLTALPDGLIALVGPNGHGKTRLLDAALAGLYGPGERRAFPSREGTLAEYATSKDAYIETVWSADGATLKARVSVDGVRRTTDAVLVQAQPELTMLNDGKSSTFKDAVTSRFPSRRSVLCSAFAAQSKNGSFVELGQKERLELFAELADLGHYQEKAATAKRCAEVAEAVVGKLRAALGVLEAETSETRERELALKLAAIVDYLKLMETTRQDARTLIVALESERTGLEAAARTGAVAEAEATALRSRLSAIEREMNADLDRLQRSHDARDKAVQDLAERIAGNQTLVAQADEIRRQAATARELQADIETLRVDLRNYDANLASLREMVRTDDLTAAQMVRDKDALVRERQHAAIAETVPCRGVGAYAACQFLARAAQAQDIIAKLVEVTSADARLAAEHAKLRDVLTQVVAQRATAERFIAEKEVAARALTLARYEPELALAEQRIAHYREQQAATEAAHVAVYQDVNARTLALEREAEEKQLSLTVAQETVARTKDARSKLADVDIRLAQHRENATAAEREIAKAEQQQQQAFADQARLAQQKMVAAEAQRRVRLVEDEQLAWQTLAKACGRDGLPKLEIDAAGPTVSSYCNELLAGAFGTRFSLEVVTQLPTADGKGLKEGFTIQVLDNEHAGEARDIADLSGGERVIVEEALRAALSCYVNARNRQPVRTLWRDETTGALDPANAPRYVALLRRLRELSGAAQILFVTHSTDCAALADAQVVVRDGQPTVVLPPYAEVA